MSSIPQETFRRRIGATNSATPSARIISPVNVQWFGAVGDGVANDYQAISNAIAATPAGGRLIFPNGTYRTDTKILVPSDIEIEGLGTVTLRGPAAGLYPIIENADTVGGNENFSIRNVVCDGQNAGDSTTALVRLLNCTEFSMMNVTVQRRVQTVPGEGALHIQSCSDAELTSCTIKDNDFEGAHIYDCDRISVNGGLFKDNQNSGAAVDYCTQVSIIGAIFNGNGTNTSSQCSFNGTSGVFSGNLLYNGKYTGIAVGHTLNVSDYSTIVGNTFVNHVQSAIIVAHSKYVTVSGNSVRNASYSGTACISLATSTPRCDNNIVSNNICIKGNRGIFAAGARNIITGNKINDIQSEGIFVDGTAGDISYNTIRDNVCVDVCQSVAGYGINVGSGAAGAGNGLTCENNYVSASSGNMLHGFLIDSQVATNALFHKNTSIGHSIGTVNMTGLTQQLLVPGPNMFAALLSQRHFMSEAFQVDAGATGGGADKFLVTITFGGLSTVFGLDLELVGNFSGTFTEAVFKRIAVGGSLANNAVWDIEQTDVASLGDAKKANITAAITAVGAVNQLLITFTNADVGAFTGTLVIKATTYGNHLTTVTVQNNHA